MSREEALRFLSELAGRELDEGDSALRLREDLSMDSLAQVELLVELEAKIGEPTVDLLDSISTVRDALHFLTLRGDG